MVARYTQHVGEQHGTVAQRHNERRAVESAGWKAVTERNFGRPKVRRESLNRVFLNVSAVTESSYP
jgi:hypothetical protein